MPAPHGAPDKKRWPASSLNLGWSEILAQKATPPQDLLNLTCLQCTTQGSQSLTSHMLESWLVVSVTPRASLLWISCPRRQACLNWAAR